MMRSVDVGIECGVFVVKGIAYKALSRKVIAFIGLDFQDHPVDAGIAFERGGVQDRAEI